MESSDRYPKSNVDRMLIYLLAAGALGIICVICLGSGMLISRYAFPDVKATRTALAEMFHTVTPLITPS